MKTYIVHIDPKYSETFKVKANNTKEARRLAFQKFKETKIKRHNYKISSRIADEFDL